VAQDHGDVDRDPGIRRREGDRRRRGDGGRQEPRGAGGMEGQVPAGLKQAALGRRLHLDADDGQVHPSAAGPSLGLHPVDALPRT